MKLTKIIPARTKTITARWCKKDFAINDGEYRNIREQMNNPMNTCFWCDYKFVDGDTIALASFEEKSGNKVLCQKCAEALLKSGRADTGRMSDEKLKEFTKDMDWRNVRDLIWENATREDRPLSSAENDLLDLLYDTHPIEYSIGYGLDTTR